MNALIIKAISTTAHLKALHLTINGFKHLFHSYVASTLHYHLYLNHAPPAFLKSLRKILVEFLWYNRVKVSLSCLIFHPSETGIGLCHLPTLQLALHTSLLIKSAFSSP